MFRRETVFIVGAGASKELGLPTGAELSQKIAQMCEVGINKFGNGTDARSNRLLDDLKRKAGADKTKINDWLLALDEIRRALPFKDSIDAVIDQYHDRPEVAEVGKYMIARLIMEAEAGSHLGGPFGEPGSINIASGTWLHSFSRMLFEGLRKDRLSEIGNNVSVICFNYDRCIERYLTYAIAETYGVANEDATEALSSLRILHVYGSLGEIPTWQSSSKSTKLLPFGGYGADPWVVAENLKTFSESVDSDIDDNIKSLVRDGSQYVYLGLSFGRQNMDLLSTDGMAFGTNFERDAYASGFGQFEQSRAAISGHIRSTYSKSGGLVIDGSLPSRTHIELGTTAKQLLDLHWHNILG